MMRRYGSFPCWRRRRWFEGGTGRREGRRLCSSSNSNADKALGGGGGGGGMTREESYRRAHDLDFMTAARILFTAPPKKKKFGLDFHLVQLFFACMPALAVYLVAQYARYEIRRMEVEVELKKQAEEEEKAKQAEEEARAKEKEMDTKRDERDPELVKVKVRLDALEEAVKEIADETKKISHGNLTKDQKGEKKEPVPIAERDSNFQDKSNANEPARSPFKEIGSGSSPTTNVSPENVREASKVEAVKEIADETKKISHGNLTKDQKGKKKEPVPIAERDSNFQDESNANEPARSPFKEIGSGSSPTTNVSPENVREASKVEDRGAPS